MTPSPTTWHVLVMAKAPVPGRVKTRLCPPLTARAAAEVAEAALVDTLEAAGHSGADRRILALDGEVGAWLPAGWTVVPQCGDGLGGRLAHAWATAGGPGVQLGMDTPQVTPDLLDEAAEATLRAGSALGRAADGGWWAVGFAEGAPAGVFDGVPMSTPWTGVAQHQRMLDLGLRPAALPVLRDVDHGADAEAVADAQPRTRFAAAWYAGVARRVS